MDYITIEKEEDFIKIKNNPSGHFILRDDIRLRGIFEFPLPSFSGVLDGNGKYISNLSIDKEGEDYTGLFSVIDKGVVKNLHLKNVDIKGSMYTGSVCGELKDGLIKNVYVDGRVTSDNKYLGGLVGYARSNIEDVIVDVDVFTDRSYNTASLFCGYKNLNSSSSHKRCIIIGENLGERRKVTSVYGHAGSGNVESVYSFNRDSNCSMQNYSGSGKSGKNLREKVNLTKEIFDKEFNNGLWEYVKGPNLNFKLKDLCNIKCLLEINKEIFTIKDNELLKIEEENITKDLILSKGFSLYNDLSFLKDHNFEDFKVHSNDKVCVNLYLNKSKKIKELLNKDSKIIVKSKNKKPSVSIGGRKKETLIFAKENIRFLRSDLILDFKIKCKKNFSTTKIFYSIDNGKTWIGKDQSKIDISNIDDVREKAFTIEEFNNVGHSWKDLLVLNKVRFAYLLQFIDEGRIKQDYIDSLTVKIKKRSILRKAKNKKDYIVKFTNDSIILDLYKDGTYKINYKEV